MDHLAAMEERLVSDRLRRKLEDVNAAAQKQLSPVQDHVNFTLQVSFPPLLCSSFFGSVLRKKSSIFCVFGERWDACRGHRSLGRWFISSMMSVALQQAYFKCAYECFDRRRKQEEISNCVEHCSVPVLNANNMVETEMAKFQVFLFSLSRFPFSKTSVLFVILIVWISRRRYLPLN